jgi:hypothetical protein
LRTAVEDTGENRIKKHSSMKKMRNKPRV